MWSFICDFAFFDDFEVCFGFVRRTRILDLLCVFSLFFVWLVNFERVFPGGDWLVCHTK